jgi:hypothetical protein
MKTLPSYACMPNIRTRLICSKVGGDGIQDRYRKDRPRQIEPHIGIMVKPQDPFKLLINIQFSLAERIGCQAKLIQN